jgi:plasmid stability protein
MATLIIRKLDDGLKLRLRVRAARLGRSMEEEAREILKSSLKPELDSTMNFAESIRRHMEPLGGVELTLPTREPVRQPPKFTK